MNPLQLLTTATDLLTVIIGFGLIVFIHELGHFLAAKWAGIRTLAFALGFGPALVSYRKGIGWRQGSSEAEYQDILRQARNSEPEEENLRERARQLGTTEYRLNALPLGGYVKMLGQEDLNPNATSAAPDSYQNCPPVKRMVVISAGVIFNIISAAILFVIVFLIGIKVEAPAVGLVQPGTPAATAQPLNAAEAGVSEPGLQEGDRITSIGGTTPESFGDIFIAVAMAKPNQDLDLTVERRGLDTPLNFAIRPEKSPETGLLSMGFSPAYSTTLFGPKALTDKVRAQIGLEEVPAGSTLLSADDIPIPNPGDALRAFETSSGQPVALTFESPEGQSITTEIDPNPEVMQAMVRISSERRTVIEHILGLTPVMRVAQVQDRAAKMGLAEGDTFIRIGPIEYPSIPAGMATIRAAAGDTIEAVVLRTNEAGEPEEVTLNLKVKRDGTVGFNVDDTLTHNTLLAIAPDRITDTDATEPRTPAAANLITRPGTRLTAVNGTPVATLAEARNELQNATRDAHANQSDAAEVTLTLELPLGRTQTTPGPTYEETWTLTAEDLARLHSLNWNPPLALGIFQPLQIISKEETPTAAIARGVHETKRLALQTYITFARLFQGSVKVEHLKGPVGIAHLGTIIADRGLIWLMFFFAMISVNLAVINFLPLPIVDGGQFLMLLYEQIRGKPVPIPIQNAVTTLGLLLIGTVFIVVTFNDVRSLLGL